MARLRTSENVGTAASEGAAALKRAAIRLFAEHGVDGVTVREIARAAGQRNPAAVGYHFDTKEALVRELVADGAKIIDARRNARLDALESAGGPSSVREVIEVIIFPALDVAASGPDDCYLRFTHILNMTHRDLFMDAVGSRWNRGYQRCLTHLRRLMPAMTAAMASQRLVFLGTYVAQVLALRQATMADTRRPHATWPSERTLDHLAATATALVMAPPEEG